MAGLTEIAVDGAIGIRAVDVEGLGNDPADRLIIATALMHDATLVTADERLLAWPHSLERHDART
jgi:PIN domain nuclease of toxin-antitoxin system